MTARPVPPAGTGNDRPGPPAGLLTALGFAAVRRIPADWPFAAVDRDGAYQRTLAELSRPGILRYTTYSATSQRKVRNMVHLGPPPFRPCLLHNSFNGVPLCWPVLLPLKKREAERDFAHPHVLPGSNRPGYCPTWPVGKSRMPAELHLPGCRRQPLASFRV